MTDDAAWMRAALTLAQRGLGRVWPNPAVGCIIVKQDRVLGRGWTQPSGRPHAETMALAQAGDAAKGATAYVSLEPCAHHGRTPPCANALIQAGVARVVSPMADPDPRVSGKGFQMLRDAGVQVDIGCMADLAEAANRGFLMRQRRGRPHVTLKLAASLDGGIATATGESRWITGPAARAAVHMMRATADAILIGGGTARADDPSLNIRLPGLDTIAPVRIVVSASGALPPDGILAATAARQPVWLCCAPGAEAPEGVEVIEVPASGGELDLTAMMSTLGDHGLTRILCEGGGALSASLLKAGLVDELVWMTAGLALGADATAALPPLGYTALADAPRFELTGQTQLGGDVVSTWRRA